MKKFCQKLKDAKSLVLLLLNSCDWLMVLVEMVYPPKES